MSLQIPTPTRHSSISNTAGPLPAVNDPTSSPPRNVLRYATAVPAPAIARSATLEAAGRYDAGPNAWPTRPDQRCRPLCAVRLCSWQAGKQFSPAARQAE